MSFQYKQTAGDKVVFTRTGAGCARFLFLFSGILFTTVGGCLIAFSESTENFMLMMNKKDGGQWELLQRSSQSDAQDEIDKLQKLITLDSTPQRADLRIEDCRKFNITKGLYKTELSWRNKLGFGPVALALFSIVFMTVFYTIVSNIPGGDLAVFAYLVLGFIGVGFVLVIGGNARKMVKNSKTEYAIAVNSNGFEYEERTFDGQARKSTRISFSELHSLAFSFDSANTQRSITIYTHQQFEQKDTIGKSLSIEAIKEAFQFEQDLVVLDLQDLTVVEALQVEHFLEEQIREKADREVVSV